MWCRGRPLSPGLANAALRQTRHVTTTTSSLAAVPSESGSTSKQAKGKVIFSGIQPTGIPHLGNYLGALRNWTDLQDSAAPNESLYFSIVGYHALTMPQDPAKLRAERTEMMATLLAIGLDPHRSTIFHQDHVSEHTELAWILNCIAPFGRLARMTTWKSKLATARHGSESEQIAVDDKDLSLGLFAYPVLQAADILLYKATHVPVGEDQVQHLELSRSLADLFNRRFKKRNFFPLPAHIVTPTKRILSLRDPASKMSKSAPDVNSRILVTDTPDQVSSKIRKAVTDSTSTLSYEPQDRPGVSNLLLLLSTLEGRLSGTQNEEDPAETAKRLNAAIEAKGASPGPYLKATLTEAIVETLRPIQSELHRLRKDAGYLQRMEDVGSAKAKHIARTTMSEVKKLVGLA